jgi:TrmH family RNA methyltransferase
VTVAVVDAETPGNVVTIARAMKNFGVADLYLVDPPPLDPDGEAYGFAGHAREDVLPNAREVAFDALVERFHTVGCTAVTGEDARRHVRYPFAAPATLADELSRVDADVCLVFGRERTGLTNDELAAIDRVCSIPASADYPVLNLGQAATLVLYELRTLTLDERQHPDEPHERAAEPEIEGLYAEFDRFLAGINHPPDKREKAARMVRRLIGRAHPTGREARTLRGLLRRANGLLEHPERLLGDDADGADNADDANESPDPGSGPSTDDG